MHKKHRKQVSGLVKVAECALDNPFMVHVRCDIRFADAYDMNAFLRLMRTYEDRETLWPQSPREFAATFMRLHRDRGLGEL